MDHQETAGTRGPRGRPRLVSVVVPVLDAAELLPFQLDALARQDYDGAVEVVIADNGSRDGSLQIARDWLPKLPSGRLVLATGVRGPSHARNAGAAVARGDCRLTSAAPPGTVQFTARRLGCARHDRLAVSLDGRRLESVRPRRGAQTRGVLTTASAGRHRLRFAAEDVSGSRCRISVRRPHFRRRAIPLGAAVR